MWSTKVFNRVVAKRLCFIRMKNIWTVDRTVTSPFNDIVVPEVTITELIWNNLDKWADKTALVC